jgi:hypothetical protein
MPSTYTASLRLVRPATGELTETWGEVFNQQFSDLIDKAIAGYTSVSMSDTDKTLTALDGAADEARYMGLKFTGALTAARSVIVPAVSKLYFVNNATTGGFALTVKTPSGTGVAVLAGNSTVVFCDGTNVVEAITQFPTETTIGDGGSNSYNIGYLEIPQNSQSANYTLVLSDSGKHIYHPVADTTARTWTIPAHASVPYPIGTALTFLVDAGAGTITLDITSDSLIFAPNGTSGTRTLTAPASATAVKVASTRWIISGSGIT